MPVAESRLALYPPHAATVEERSENFAFSCLASRVQHPEPEIASELIDIGQLQLEPSGI